MIIFTIYQNATAQDFIHTALHAVWKAELLFFPQSLSIANCYTTFKYPII